MSENSHLLLQSTEMTSNCNLSGTKTKRKVEKRNTRERTRIGVINTTYQTLRRFFPPKKSGRRMSKLEILQRTINYIKDLTEALNTDSPSSPSKLVNTELPKKPRASKTKLQHVFSDMELQELDFEINSPTSFNTSCSDFSFTQLAHSAFEDCTSAGLEPEQLMFTTQTDTTSSLYSAVPTSYYQEPVTQDLNIYNNISCQQSQHVYSPTASNTSISSQSSYHCNENNVVHYSNAPSYENNVENWFNTNANSPNVECAETYYTYENSYSQNSQYPLTHYAW